MNSIELLLAKLKEENLLKDEVKFSRGYRIIQSGEVEKYIYLVKDGAFKIFFIHDDEEYITRLAYTGDLVTALDSFINNEPTSFYIEALRASVVVRITKADYLRFIQSSSENIQLWNVLQTGLIYQQMEREKDLLIPSPQERYERVLARSPKLFQEVPLKYIAAYLRMTPETLSRIMNS